MIGVCNNDYDAKKLKLVMDKHRLNWRSFADPRGTINAQWNTPMTPAYYVIDPKGVIRHKWAGSPGAMAIDAALDGLIREATGRSTGGDGPRGPGATRRSRGGP